MVDGTRQIPRVEFPWLVNVVRRSLAGRRPFLCPICDTPIETS
jgi:hypothetical protein